jgi:hypothetical protein
VISLALAAALLAGAAEPAAQGAMPASPPSKSAKANPNDMVCKKEAVVGSRLKQRVCLTQAQWDQKKMDAQKELDEGQRNQPLRGG